MYAIIEMEYNKLPPHFPAIFNHSGESETAQRVYSILSNTLGYKPEDLERGTKLVDDLGMDSVDIVDIADSLEDGFKNGLRVEYDDIEGMVTVGNIIDYVESKLNELAKLRATS